MLQGNFKLQVHFYAVHSKEGAECLFLYLTAPQIYSKPCLCLVNEEAERCTTRIEHAEVLPGSWKAGVPEGPVAHGNDALLFAVAGLRHQVHGFVVETL